MKVICYTSSTLRKRKNKKAKKRKACKTKLLSGEKGAVGCACPYLFISLLINRKNHYKAVFLFSYYTLRMRKVIDRKNTDCFPLWRERGNDDNSLSSLAVSP